MPRVSNSSSRRHFNRTRSTHVPFDPVMAERCFSNRKENTLTKRDDDIKQWVLERHEQLLPPHQELSLVTQLATRVQAILDELIISSQIDGCDICEVRQVESLRKQLLLKGECKAELVVVLKTFPTLDSVTKLAEFVIAKNNEGNQASQENSNQFTKGNSLEWSFETLESGFSVLERREEGEFTALVHVTTVTSNFHRLTDLHLSLDACRLGHRLLFECRWFEENILSHSNVKVLIRIILDMRQRFEDLKPLKGTMIERLAHFCVLNVHESRERQLHLGRAFTRILQSLAGGLFAPGSFFLSDPLNNGNEYKLRVFDQERVCCTAQTLLNILFLGGTRHVLGLVQDSGRIVKEATEWNGVVVNPMVPISRADERNEEETNEGDHAAV